MANSVWQYKSSHKLALLNITDGEWNMSRGAHEHCRFMTQERREVETSLDVRGSKWQRGYCMSVELSVVSLLGGCKKK